MMYQRSTVIGGEFDYRDGPTVKHVRLDPAEGNALVLTTYGPAGRDGDREFLVPWNLICSAIELRAEVVVLRVERFGDQSIGQIVTDPEEIASAFATFDTEEDT